jgi:hypothetical protein
LETVQQTQHTVQLEHAVSSSLQDVQTC